MRERNVLSSFFKWSFFVAPENAEPIFFVARHFASFETEPNVNIILLTFSVPGWQNGVEEGTNKQMDGWIWVDVLCG